MHHLATKLAGGARGAITSSPALARLRFASASGEPQKERRKEQQQHDLGIIVKIKAEHADVAAAFDEYERAPPKERKLALARRVISALSVHAAKEEAVLYLGA